MIAFSIATLNILALSMMVLIAAFNVIENQNNDTQVNGFKCFTQHK
jgi:hypothetical protein